MTGFAQMRQFLNGRSKGHLLQRAFVFTQVSAVCLTFTLFRRKVVNMHVTCDLLGQSV